ncbi:MAG TPA: helix-turn-helix domain-containing protein [Solirubrobacteraceae bacterium]
MSRSFLLGLMVLSCFAVAEMDLGVVAVAGMLRMEPSTTHRYMKTLLVVGLLEQDPSTRRYRLAGA